MGNPTSGCIPDQAPMTLPKGSSRHRPSLSISSLPSEKLGRINCEKRASVSARSSPARGVTEPEKQSIASILSHGNHQDATRKKPSRNGTEKHLKGIELASEDRKLTSFNPFRGHRRVGSGSNITIPSGKTSWDYSPRARLAGSSSVASSPKKLEKYAVAKIAASLFQSPAKLERSMSMSRIAHKSSTPQVEKKRNRGPPLTVGEVILPGTCVQQRSPQSKHTADDGQHPKWSSSDCLAVDMDETATPLAPNASSIQNHVIDNTKPLEEEGTAQELTTLVEEPPPTSELAFSPSQVFENAAEMMHEEYASPQDVASSSSSPHCSYMPSGQSCGMSETSMKLPDSPVSVAALFEDTAEEETHAFEEETHAFEGETRAFEEETHAFEGETRAFEEETHAFEEDTHAFEGEIHAFEGETNAGVDDNLECLLFATEKVTEEALTEAAVRCSISSEEYDNSTGPHVSVSEEELSLVPNPLTLGLNSLERDTSVSRALSPRRSSDELLTCSKRISVVKSTLRKRRRSVSASGIGAMLLKVVRVPESAGIIVARTSLESREMISRVEARKYALEDSATHIESMRLMPNNSAAVACQTESDPEDAVKSTYSKFVDIEIDTGHGCVELVQHSLDVAHDVGVDDAGWKRNQQAGSQDTLLGKSSRHLPHVKINTCTVHEGKTRPRRTKTIRRGRLNSYDLDSLTEFLRTTSDSFNGLAQFDTTTTNRPTTAAEAEAQTLTDSNPMSTRQRSRTFVSRLQAPSSSASSYVDVYRPCSVSILSNPSFSSSHQDKIWEEQAEIYSSGGRGTPGREDEPGAPPPPQQATLVFNLHHHPPSPGFGNPNSSHHLSPAMRRSGLSVRGGSPSESGHFMQQIMSKIRGTSPKASRSSSCPNSQLDMSKRRNPWSSCICFSVKS